jgi:hypothetical protein
MTRELFEGNYSLNWQAIIHNMDHAIDFLSDSELLDDTDASLTERVSDEFRFTHPTIDESAEASVERGRGATDPGLIVYKHLITDPSTVLRYNLSGMLFPAPRHRIEGDRLVLSYPAEQGAERAKRQHESDLKTFLQNVHAARVNIDTFNKAIENYVSGALKRAKAAAESRKKLAGEL